MDGAMFEQQAVPFNRLLDVWGTSPSLRQLGLESREPRSKLFKPTAPLIPQEVTICFSKAA